METMEAQSERSSSGDPRFGHISRLALGLLSLPFSNAAVERVFSVMNAVKTKSRNRLLVEMVQSIMKVRFGLSLRGENCNDMTVTPSMLTLFNSKMYDYEGDDEDLTATAMSIVSESDYR